MEKGGGKELLFPLSGLSCGERGITGKEEESVMLLLLSLGFDRSSKGISTCKEKNCDFLPLKRTGVGIL